MSINRKKEKAFIVRLLVLIFSYYAISLCFIGKEQIKMRIASKEILLPIYLKYGYKLDLWGVIIDREAKTFKCTFSINHRKMYKEVNMISKVNKGINRYLEKNKDYFLNDGYEISVFINTKQTEFVYLTNKPIFEIQKGLSKGLKNADIQINGYISLLKGFNDLESMIISLESYSDLSVLKRFSKLKYIAFDEELNEERMNAVRRILPECKVEDFWNTHPSWDQKFK